MERQGVRRERAEERVRERERRRSRERGLVGVGVVGEEREERWEEREVSLAAMEDHLDLKCWARGVESRRA